MSIFYRPSDGFVGDVIPFYWAGNYHAFYLKAPLPPLRDGADHTPYAHLVSSGLAHWEEWPLAIEPGGPGEPDAVSCFTGSVIERDGVFFLFYTGYRGQDLSQTICVATSQDLRTWDKDERNPIVVADKRWYEQIDWRDPFVFWNERAGEYWMLLAAREREGPENRRGCIALVTSPDLDQWMVQPPFWAPRLYYTHECPDLFRWEGKWVLVCSTFSERHETHYRMSDSLSGPWYAPANDTFDGRAFYAAKTASDGRRRFVFAWNPTREGCTDEGQWQWAGNLEVHEVVSGTDGYLEVRLPPEVAAQFRHEQMLVPRPLFGTWHCEDETYTARAHDGFSACAVGRFTDDVMVSLSITCEPRARACGVLLRAADDLNAYYQVRWEPGRQRIVFDRWPRPGDEPFMIERPLEGGLDTPLNLQIVIEESVVVIYANESVALSARAYDHADGQLVLFVSEGGASFSNVTVRTAE